MKKRSKQPEVTRKAILQAAGVGFANHGYASTGIGEIAQSSGMTRGALFHHFIDKHGLALAWVQSELSPAVDQKCIAPFHGIDGFTQWKAAWLNLAGELAVDHPVTLLNRMGFEWASDSTLKSAIASLLDRWSEEVSANLEEGQRAGWIHRSIRPVDESAVLVAQLCGASLLVRLAEEPGSAIARCQRSLASYLETLKGE